MSESVLLCYSTAPNIDTAKDLAQRLVRSRLAACVSIVPGALSVYQWQGELCESQEVWLLIKTMASSFQSLQTAWVEWHPYELPELVAVQASHVLPAYQQWVFEETRGV
jgi:periplasmic divalent cation tolerance protein